MISLARPLPELEPAEAPWAGRRVLFIGGSINQTTQMEKIADELPEIRPTFAPYYQDGLGALGYHLGLIEVTIGGKKMQGRCLEHLAKNRREIDRFGDRHDYDLVLLSSDLRYMNNLRRRPVVLVQEGILDPPNVVFPLIRRLHNLPRWWAGTAATGLSKRYVKFCVASEGYREYFTRIGCDPRTIEVTGIPNFDDCDQYRRNDFPHKGYVLVCTSDARETLKSDDRRGFLENAIRIAGGRKMVFKLHPNEDQARATSEIRALVPDAIVYGTGKAEEMVANADVLVCQYSSLAFVGLALGKEVHSFHDQIELKRLLPIQNRAAAKNIAQVVRRLLAAKVQGHPLTPGTI